MPGYLFLGGLASASSLLAAFALLAGDRELPRAAKVGAAGAIGLSAVALIHDPGRPERFLNMLRAFKVTSPVSIGSWLLAAYGPVAGAAAASAVTGRLPRGRGDRNCRRRRARPRHRHVHSGTAVRHGRARLVRGLP